MSSTPDDVVESVKSLARVGDAAAIEASLSRLDMRRAAEVLISAQGELYWTNKDAAAVLTLSRVGIAFLLRSAERSSSDADGAHHPGHEAKALAYNLGSFTWPGWDEAGITLRAVDVAAGLEAARLNLRLAEELHRPEKAKANAYWLLGAHQLAAAEYGPASASFRAGRLHAGRSDDASLGAMLDGYLLLTGVLSEPDNVQARRELDSAIARLRDDGTDDGREYANQLGTALAALREHGERRTAG